MDQPDQQDQHQQDPVLWKRLLYNQQKQTMIPVSDHMCQKIKMCLNDVQDQALPEKEEHDSDAQRSERYAMCAEKGLVPYMPVRPSTHLGRTGPDQIGCVFFKLVVH